MTDSPLPPLLREVERLDPDRRAVFDAVRALPGRLGEERGDRWPLSAGQLREDGELLLAQLRDACPGCGPEAHARARARLLVTDRRAVLVGRGHRLLEEWRWAGC